MMTERKTIYLDDALEAIQRLPNAGTYWFVSAEAVFDALLKLPSAQPETCAYWDKESNICALHRPSAQPERKSGKWINHRNDNGHNIADCDQCGHAIQWFNGDETPKYCCMCGSYNAEEGEK